MKISSIGSTTGLSTESTLQEIRDNQTDGDQIVSTKTPLTASPPTTATATTTSALIIASNSSRRGLVIINTSASRSTSFGIGATAVSGRGITLTPGGVWVLDEYTFNTSAINAITNAGTAILSIQEFT